MAGWADLGNIIAGGAEASSNRAYEEGRFRSAQTEDALSAARANQAKALATERENEARKNLRSMSELGGVDYANPTAHLMTEALLGNLAGDMSQIGDYQNKAQQFRLRDTMANPEQSALSRTRAGQALEGKPSSDLVVMGGNAVTNLTDDTPELSIMAGLGGQSDGTSTPMKIYRDREALIASGASPTQIQTYDNIVRQQVVQGGGGVPYIAPINPQAAPAPLVAPSQVASNTAGTNAAKVTSGLQAKLTNALPTVKNNLDQFRQNVSNFLASPGFDTVYGKSGAANRLAPEFLQQKNFRDANALHGQLNAQAFMNSVQSLRGLGALSNAEGARAETALTAALAPAQDETQARALWQNFFAQLDTLEAVAEQEAGQLQSFATEAEAAAAGIQPGTKVIIGGQVGEWE